ncbi:MAG: hypothetical protein K1X55_14955 [Chitinophagales bacterium]|nr:hypothetical protein [Chitinophagales bacterium]
MIRLFQVLFLVYLNGVLPINTYGQNPKAIVVAKKMDVMYIGIDNPIEVYVEDLDISEFDITVNQGVVEWMENKTYKVIPKNLGTLSVYVNKKDGSPITQQNFRVKDIPLPVAMCGFKRSGSKIPASHMKAQQGISCVLDNFDFDVRYQIVSFNCKLYQKEGGFLEVNNEGAPFSEQLKSDILKTVNSGDVIIFTDIRVKSPSGNELVIAPIFYLIE